jgi:hypothetical protein
MLAMNPMGKHCLNFVKVLILDQCECNTIHGCSMHPSSTAGLRRFLSSGGRAWIIEPRRNKGEQGRLVES